MGWSTKLLALILTFACSDEFGDSGRGQERFRGNNNVSYYSQEVEPTATPETGVASPVPSTSSPEPIQPIQSVSPVATATETPTLTPTPSPSPSSAATSTPIATMSPTPSPTATMQARVEPGRIVASFRKLGHWFRADGSNGCQNLTNDGQCDSWQGVRSLITISPNGAQGVISNCPANTIEMTSARNADNPAYQPEYSVCIVPPVNSSVLLTEVLKPANNPPGLVCGAYDRRTGQRWGCGENPCMAGSFGIQTSNDVTICIVGTPATARNAAIPGFVTGGQCYAPGQGYPNDVFTWGQQTANGLTVRISDNPSCWLYVYNGSR